MAIFQEKPASITTSPLMEDQEQEKYKNEDHETAVFDNGCGCFRVFGFKKWRSNNIDEDNYLLQHREPWWAEKLKKVKEASEMIAGPKWKTFIRKLGGYCNMKRNKHKKMNNNNMFQYSPQSYALNFDNGVDDDKENDGFAS